MEEEFDVFGGGGGSVQSGRGGGPNGGGRQGGSGGRAGAPQGQEEGTARISPTRQHGRDTATFLPPETARLHWVISEAPCFLNTAIFRVQIWSPAGCSLESE